MTVASDPLKMLQWILADHPGEAAAELRAAVERVLDGTESSLDRALGLKPAAGQRSWRTTAALEERNRLICETATTFFPENTSREKAEAIAAGLERFRSGADWQGCRTREICPYPQGIKANFWRILKAFDRNLSAATVRAVLANELGLFVSQQMPDDSSNDQ
ncbi:hypothetical protein EOS93_10150 [Rhizobium sp. RMa-01]|uniref:hypothetical protein n=1 Tax=unclassified Rhizobium TaxID=2613769 RepID=UPI0008DA1810|nr:MULTISPECIES: hypothetical protein [unclassified Rhizobium]OHV26225.1 hypothetical protein BBJ66_05775 [Rhizobium sp. RSm-3]RVU11161.1 hypothetical protein EOS93_10150 [Rhizobium sp. RMa-01]